MSKFIYTGAVALLLLGAALAPQAYAETTTGSAAMLEQVKTLMAKIAELQKQLATIRGEVKDAIKDGLAEGMTDEDIKEVQELLASDPTIYPEGKVTGYFGPMTKEAIKRFQTRHELQVTGSIDSETKALMEEYFKERYGGKVPPGLMKAPGIMKKVQERFEKGCDEKKAMGPLCKKIQERKRDRDRDRDGKGWDDDSDDDSNDEELDVEIEIEGDYTKVTFELDDVKYKVVLKSSDEDDVLEAVADAIDDGDDASDLDEDLKDAIEDMLEDVVVKTEAEEAIDDAEKAIDDARDAIEDASGDTEPADDKADDAEDKLAEAVAEFEDENYDDAKTFADAAKELADDAVDLLPETV